MPQPLSSIWPKVGSINIGNVGDYPLGRHSDLALLIAEVIASWANVENFMLALFIDLMGGPKDKAAILFLALDSHGPKSAAINAIADATLSDEHKALLRAILAISKTNQKTRDKIAHWTWGDSPELPDALLLADPKDLVVVDDFASVLDLDTLLIPNIYVYKANDFQTAIKANERLTKYGFDLRFILRGHPANEDNRLYDQLCAESEIRERLARPA